MSEQDALARAAALEAEVALLRQAMQRFFTEAYIDLADPRLDAPDFRLTGMKEIRDLLAQPPGAAGQAVLDAGDQLAHWLQVWINDHPEHTWCYSEAALAVWKQARSGAPSARATGGQPRCEGG